MSQPSCRQPHTSRWEAAVNFCNVIQVSFTCRRGQVLAAVKITIVLWVLMPSSLTGSPEISVGSKEQFRMWIRPLPLPPKGAAVLWYRRQPNLTVKKWNATDVTHFECLQSHIFERSVQLRKSVDIYNIFCRRTVTYVFNLSRRSRYDLLWSSKLISK
jgi:hypothetical protein